MTKQRWDVLLCCGVMCLAHVGSAAEPQNTNAGHSRNSSFPYRLDYQYERASSAYCGDCSQMHEYSVDEQIYRTVVTCNISDGEIRSAMNGIAPHCRNANYMYGRSEDGQYIYRTQDGENWENLGNYQTRWMYALSNNTLIRLWRTEDDYETLSFSTDDGLTWQRAKWAGSGEDFAWITPQAYLMPFGFHQADNGTIIMVEYLLPEGGRYIYRSDDHGVTWQTVHDAGVGIISHYHAVTKHEGLGRWVAVTGDDQPRQKLIVSDDDGLTWYDYTIAGELYMQPTYLHDYGHPTRLLFGSDLFWQVGWLDVSDEASAKQVGPVITNWNLASGRALCWYIFQHDGLYYACSLDHSHTNDRNVVISVSADLQHWAIYHRFVQNELGVLRFAGDVNGQLHLCVWADGANKHLVLSPATIQTHEGRVLAPPADNMFDSVVTSSAASTVDWLNLSEAVPPGSGQKGLLEVVSSTAHHGTSCVHYSRSDGGYMRLATPAIIFEVGAIYQGRLWIKGKGGKAYVQWQRNGDSVGEPSMYALSEETWRAVVTTAYTVPEDTTDLRLRLTLLSTLDNTCEAYVDSLQVETTPGTHWHIGGATRAAASLETTVSSTGQWTSVFSIEPEVMSEHLDDVGELHLTKYETAPDTYVELYYDGGEARFKLRPTINGFTYAPVATSPQHFQRRAHVRIAVRCCDDELGLTIANGRALESITTKTYLGPEPGNLTISYGGTAYGKYVLPITFFNDSFYDEYVLDEQLLGIMNDLGTRISSRGNRVTGSAVSQSNNISTDDETALSSSTADFARVQCQAYETVKLTAADAAWYDYAGDAVSISDDVAVVGAYGTAVGGECSGSVCVYRYDNSAWIEEVKLELPTAAAYDYFGSAVSVSGDVAVIGAYGTDLAGSRSGSAYVYRHNGSIWVVEDTLTSADAMDGDEFGKAVSISGDVIVVGADGDDDAGESSGSAYVYRYNPVTESWSQEAKLTATDAAGGNQFGISVSVDGDVVVIGSRFDDDAGGRAGSAYVYRYNAGYWVEEDKLTASDAAVDDAFGYSVSVSGDTAVIGAYGDDDGGESSGSAYVFYYTGGVWVEEAKLTAGDAAACDYFGYSVSIDGDFVSVGAYGTDEAGESSGSAYIFGFDGINWIEQAEFRATDAAPYHYFGNSVSISNAKAVVGVYRDDDAGHGSGSVCVFAGLSDCNTNDQLDLCDINAGTSRDCNINGIPDECDIVSGTSQDKTGNGIPDECEILGDLNCDGQLNSLDIDPFVLALSSGPTFEDYYAAYPDCDPMFADCNEDGSINSLDIDVFVDLLVGS